MRKITRQTLLHSGLATAGAAEDLGQGWKVNPTRKFQPLADDIASVAYWDQKEPHGAFPKLPPLTKRWPRRPAAHCCSLSFETAVLADRLWGAAFESALASDPHSRSGLCTYVSSLRNKSGCEASPPRSH